MQMEPETKKKRAWGFQTLPPERRREIAALGGKEAHRRRHAHRWTPEEAREMEQKRWAGRRTGTGHARTKKA